MSLQLRKREVDSASFPDQSFASAMISKSVVYQELFQVKTAQIINHIFICLHNDCVDTDRDVVHVTTAILATPTIYGWI